MKIAILPGDGIGPEIVAEAQRVFERLRRDGIAVETETAPIGGAGYDAAGQPLPEATLKLAQDADAVLMGAVGGPKYDTLPRALRPEQGLLAIRKALGLFANLRPALLYPELAAVSSLKPEVVAGLDLMIVRELTGDIYFGSPRGRRTNAAGATEGFDTMLYSEPEIRRIARVGFEIAAKRGGKLCSVDKANVLDTSILWREVVSSMAADFPAVQLSHMYVDNAAMQLVRNPRQFDVIVTGNMFGDILSDEASMLAGSIGMLPSASLDAHGQGTLRTHTRFGAGHRGPRQGQSAGDHTVDGDDVSLHLRSSGSRGAHRERGAARARGGLAHRRYRAAGRFRGRHPRHGRRGRGCAVSGP